MIDRSTRLYIPVHTVVTVITHGACSRLCHSVVHCSDNSFELLFIDASITVPIELCNHVLKLLRLYVNLHSTACHNSHIVLQRC